MWSNEYVDEDFNIRDGIYGVVTGKCTSGENGFLEIQEESVIPLKWSSVKFWG